MVAEDWAWCVRREATAARTDESTDAPLRAVLSACQSYAEPFERLAKQEVGEEKARRLLRSHVQTIEEIGRSTLRGERINGPERLYTQVRKCIDDETALAATSSLEGEGLVRAVRARCSPIEERANAEIEANLGSAQMREMQPDIDRVLNALILQRVADFRTGRVRRR